jgi:hypothetical protein
MRPALFPRRRPDGTFTVAASFSLADSSLRSLVGEQVSTWALEKRTAGIDLDREFSSLPRVEGIEDDRVDVVFDGRKDSTTWKDWLIDLSRRIRDSSDQVTFEGFFDRVSGTAHPASLPR